MEQEQAPTSMDSLGRDPISCIAAFLTGKEMCGVACLCDAWRWVGRAPRADKAWCDSEQRAFTCARI